MSDAMLRSLAGEMLTAAKPDWVALGVSSISIEEDRYAQNSIRITIGMFKAEAHAAFTVEQGVAEDECLARIDKVIRAIADAHGVTPVDAFVDVSVQEVGGDPDVA